MIVAGVVVGVGSGYLKSVRVQPSAFIHMFCHMFIQSKLFQPVRRELRNIMLARKGEIEEQDFRTFRPNDAAPPSAIVVR